MIKEMEILEAYLKNNYNILLFHVGGEGKGVR
jgi:hypothetical protein